MVVIHMKKGEESLFNYSTSVNSDLSDITVAIAKLNNDRKRLERLISATKELLLYGPEKEESEKGYSQEEIDKLGKEDEDDGKKESITKNGFTFYKVNCPTGTRIGLQAGKEARDCITSTLVVAEAILSKEQVKANQLLNEKQIQEQFNLISGALTIVYPEGLPPWDASKLALEDKEELEGSSAIKDYFNPNDCSLWWAGKELQRTHKLSHYVGNNDKTKLIIKIQKKGSGPPSREAPLNEEEQKNMMAYYYKKQEELKRISENQDDDYINSSWADPKSLKKAFTGMGSNIRF